MQTKKELLFEDLKVAKTRLAEVLALEKTDIIRDSAVQRFEFTFELAWKLIQEILMGERMEARTMKDRFRMAADLELIDKPEWWFKFLAMRNLTVHTYKQEIAEEIYGCLRDFLIEIERLVERAERFVG